MKYTLLLSIILTLLFACSKSGEPGAPVDPEEQAFEQIKKQILNAARDTINLKVTGFGKAYSNSDTSAFALGLKNGKLWCGFFEGSETSGFKEKRIWISKDVYTDTMVIDNGYGQYDIVRPETPFGGRDQDAFVIDQNNFAIFPGYPRSIYIYKNIPYKSQLPIFCEILEICTNGYTVNFYPSLGGVNLKGETLFYFGEGGTCDGGILMGIDEYIMWESQKANLKVSRNKPGGNIWETRIENLGSVINYYRPRFDINHELSGTILTLEIKITNYDGTKEEKTVKLETDTGKIMD